MVAVFLPLKGEIEGVWTRETVRFFRPPLAPPDSGGEKVTLRLPDARRRHRSWRRFYLLRFVSLKRIAFLCLWQIVPVTDAIYYFYDGFIFFSIDPQFFLFYLSHPSQRERVLCNLLIISLIDSSFCCDTSVTHLWHIWNSTSSVTQIARLAEFAIRQNPAIWITSLYHAIRNPYWKWTKPSMVFKESNLSTTKLHNFT